MCVQLFWNVPHYIPIYTYISFISMQILNINEWRKNQRAHHFKQKEMWVKRFIPVLYLYSTLFLLLCWVNMYWNVPMENHCWNALTIQHVGAGSAVDCKQSLHSQPCMCGPKYVRKKYLSEYVFTVRNIWWRHTFALQNITVPIYPHYGNVSCWICSNVTGPQLIEMQSTHDIKHLACKTT